MSETDTEAEPVDEPEPETDDEDSKPEVDDESTIDVDLDAVDEDLEADDRDDEPEPDSSEGHDLSSTKPIEGDTMGDMYVKGLVGVSNAVIEKNGGDPIGEKMANQLELDDAMNRWIRTRGQTEDLPPGQAVVIGTTIFAMAVLASNPEVVGSALEVME